MRLGGTYLAWVDFSKTGLAPEAVVQPGSQRVRIFASPGSQFGPGGETWLRFNFATPRPILERCRDSTPRRRSRTYEKVAGVNIAVAVAVPSSPARKKLVLNPAQPRFFT